MKRQSSADRARARRLALLRDRRRKRRAERIREKRLNVERELNLRRAFARRHNLIYDTDLQRLPVVLPQVFSLSENYEATVAILNAVRENALILDQPILLHWEHVTTIEAAAALALVAEIYRVRNLRSKQMLAGTYPRSWDVYEALKNMGFFKLLDVAELGDAPNPEIDPDQPIYLKFITDNRADWGLADAFVSIVEKRVMSFNELARQRLVKAIGEAINNTLDHAHPVAVPGSMKNRWWLSARTNVVRKEICVVILDQGVGIPETLDPNDYEQLRAFLTNILQFRLSAEPTDGEMILAATAYRRSGTGSEGRGRGFHDMKEFIDVCSDGELRVLSNRGSYHYIGGREQFSDHERTLGGTLIEWRFRHESIVELKDG